MQQAKSHMLGCGCPNCNTSIGEQEIERFLTENNIKFIPQKTFPTCKHKRLLRFDFYLPEIDLLIEYQGKQHFEPSEYFGGQKEFEYRTMLDEIKRKWCQDNSVELLYIDYTEEVDNILHQRLNKCQKIKT